MTLTFTPATAADIPALQALAEQIWHGHYPGIISIAQIDYMLARFFATPTLRQELETGTTWELACLESRPVAFLACTPEPAGARLKLNKLYLLPELHGRGLGQQMLARVAVLAERTQARETYLTVNKGNTKAIRAYERAGFRRSHSIVTKIGDGFVMDDFVMTLPAASRVADFARA